jgi:hypothetical protein
LTKLVDQQDEVIRTMCSWEDLDLGWALDEAANAGDARPPP